MVSSATLYISLFFIILVGLIIALAIGNSSSSASVVVNTPAIVSASSVNLCNTCSIVNEESFVTTLQGGAVGIKRALLIGCNYNYTGSPAISMGAVLRGCINDVRNIQSLLLSRGYLESNITMLCDDGSATFPSKSTILSSLNAMVDSMNPADITFVWYSGHGAQLRNSSADHGNNECWCPPDTLVSRNYLLDSEINTIAARAPANSTLFIGSDSCHSGTVLDLQYILIDPSGVNQNRSIDSVRGKAPTAIPVTLQASNFSPNSPIEKVVGTTNVVFDSYYNLIPALVIGISGCQDFDTSADTQLNGLAQGAMTWAFLGSLQSTTVSSTLLTMRKSLERYAQVPQLTLSQPIDPNSSSLLTILGL